MQAKRLELCPAPSAAPSRRRRAPPAAKSTKTTKKTELTRRDKTTRKATITLEDGYVVIKIPFSSDGKPSSTGKTNIHAATHGPRRVYEETANGPVPVIINNGYLKAIASVFAAPDSLKNDKTDSSN